MRACVAPLAPLSRDVGIAGGSQFEPLLLPADACVQIRRRAGGTASKEPVSPFPGLSNLFGHSTRRGEGTATLMKLHDPCGSLDCCRLDDRLESEGCVLYFLFFFSFGILPAFLPVTGGCWKWNSGVCFLLPTAASDRSAHAGIYLLMILTRAVVVFEYELKLTPTRMKYNESVGFNEETKITEAADERRIFIAERPDAPLGTMLNGGPREFVAIMQLQRKVPQRNPQNNTGPFTK